MKALYLAIIGSALLTAYAPDITLASDHVGAKAVTGSHRGPVAAMQEAATIQAAPAACMIIGESLTPGLPYANGGVAAHVYNLARKLPTDLEGRAVVMIGRKYITLNITKTGNGSIISFISEGELEMITEATEKPGAVRVLIAHQLLQDTAYVPAEPPAAILSCANAAPVQTAQSYQ